MYTIWQYSVFNRFGLQVDNLPARISSTMTLATRRGLDAEYGYKWFDVRARSGDEFQLSDFYRCVACSNAHPRKKKKNKIKKGLRQRIQSWQCFTDFFFFFHV
jgi:hypothetical protein